MFSSAISSNSCFILCSFSLREELFGLLSKSFYMTFSSSIKEISLFLLFRALRLEYFMVKALIDIFIRSHLRPLSSKQLYSFFIPGIALLNSLTNYSSFNRLLLNFQNPWPRLCF